MLNEAQALPWVLDRMPAGYRPIVVDNGSTDDSAEIAQRRGARVVRAKVRGFGAACFAGLEASGSDIVCFMDCDSSLDPRALPEVVAPVLAGTSDLVLGARLAVDGAWPLHARLANRVLVLVLRHRSGLRLEDLGPMRAARRVELLRLGIEDRRSGWPLEMILRARAANWRIAEVPVAYLPRAGRSKVTGTLLGTLHAVADMLRVLREHDAVCPPGAVAGGGASARSSGAARGAGPEGTV